jgi:hypothetical protein
MTRPVANVSRSSGVVNCPRVLSLTLSRPSDLSLGWLDGLPHAQTLCAAVCLKGMQCNSEIARRSLGSLRKMRVHSCVEEPGGHENGHEGVCAFRFLLDNYEAPWEGVYFLHGDVVAPKHAVQYHAFVRYLQRARWPEWPARRADLREEHCGCGAIGEYLAPFGPRDFWFLALTWWLGTMVEPRAPQERDVATAWAAAADCHRGHCSRAGVGAWPLHRGVLSSPLGFMFGVDRQSALQRSKHFLAVQYRLCKVGVRVLPNGMSGAGRAAWLPRPGFDYNPLVYGHVNERVPYWLFSHEFVERELPGCLLEGDHASMNCTQPEVGLARQTPSWLSHHIVDAVRQHRNASHARATPFGRAVAPVSGVLLRPATASACQPFHEECGSTGRGRSAG